MITESYHAYKDYQVRIRAVTNGGMGFSIFRYYPNPSKMNETKRVKLREKIYRFTSADSLLKEAYNYIDQYDDRLQFKFKRLTT